MDTPPNFGDDGNLAATLSALHRENLPDNMLFPGMLNEDWSSPEPSAPQMPEEEPTDETPPFDPSAAVNDRNQGIAAGPNPPFMAKDAGGNPVNAESMSRELAQFPERTPPKWWQRAGAGALGALAGIANAGGHMRHPIDVSGATEGILHPGYQDKLESWRSRVIPQELQLQLAAQMRQAQLAQQKQASEAQLKQAQSEAALGQAKRWNATADHLATLDRNATITATPELAKISGGSISPGQRLPVAVARDLYKAAAAAAVKMTVLKPGDVAMQGGEQVGENTNPRFAPQRPIVTRPQDIVVDPVTGKEIARNANHREFAPRVGRAGGGKDPQQAFTDIENMKQQSLAAAERQFLQDHDQEKLAANKAKAQSAYEKGIIRKHGTVTPQSGGGYTEQDIRAKARAAGKDENAVVKAARDKGLIQ